MPGLPATRRENAVNADRPTPTPGGEAMLDRCGPKDLLPLPDGPAPEDLLPVEHVGPDELLPDGRGHPKAGGAP